MSFPPYPEFHDPAEQPDAPASVQMESIIHAAARRVEKNNLASISYDLEITDTHGNTVKGHGIIKAKGSWFGGR